MNKREKARLLTLKHMSKEELMILYYATKQERAITIDKKRERIFEECKGVRTQKRAKNTFSREQAGTCGSYISVKRFEGSRITCVCKSRMY